VRRLTCCFARLGAEIGYGDPNLTAMVSENYEKMVKRRQITCAWPSTFGLVNELLGNGRLMYISCIWAIFDGL